MIKFPEQGKTEEIVMAELDQAGLNDAKWRDGRTFSLVFYPGEDIYEISKKAYTRYFSENGLNPSAFGSLRKFETEVVSMVADLFHGDEAVCGNMTAGGTESILIAVKCARDWARANKPEIKLPEVVLPASAHPAFHKACDYFGLKAVLVPVASDFRASMEDFRAALNENTVLLVGSAPSYPQGVVDPIRQIAALALEHQLLCHVDACVGGMIIPFLKMMGQEIPDFDFAVPGVTSISVDLHKYGYASKGSSAVLYRNKELRNYQFHVYTDWPGGIYASPTVTGTRPGGAFSATWAVINYLGIEGYKTLHQRAMDAAKQIRAGVDSIEGVHILGDPDLTIMSLGSDSLDIYEIADHMYDRDWLLDRQQNPACLHLTVGQIHLDHVGEFLNDLSWAVGKAQKLNPDKLAKNLQINFVKGLSKILPEATFNKFQKYVSEHSDVALGKSAAMYGMMGTLRNQGSLHEMVMDFMNKLHSTDK